MSTYTDIKSRIKENIAAKTDDRTISAKTVFVNRENVYYGTFIGDVTASALTLPDGFLSGLSFERSVFVNPVLSSYISSYEDGVQAVSLEISDLQQMSCAIFSMKQCLMSHFLEKDPMEYSVVDIASAFIDLKNSLSGF